MATKILINSLPGNPPLVGISSKLMLYNPVVQARYLTHAVAGIIGSVFGAYYYLKFVKIMYFDAPAEPYALRSAPVETALLLLASLIVSPLGYLLIGPLGHWADAAAGSLS